MVTVGKAKAIAGFSSETLKKNILPGRLLNEARSELFGGDKLACKREVGTFCPVQFLFCRKFKNNVN